MVQTRVAQTLDATNLGGAGRIGPQSAMPVARFRPRAARTRVPATPTRPVIVRLAALVLGSAAALAIFMTLAFAAGTIVLSNLAP